MGNLINNRWDEELLKARALPRNTNSSWQKIFWASFLGQGMPVAWAISKIPGEKQHEPSIREFWWNKRQALLNQDNRTWQQKKQKECCACQRQMNTALFLTCFVNSDETLSTFHKEGHNQQTFKIMNILRTNTRIKICGFFLDSL